MALVKSVEELEISLSSSQVSNTGTLTKSQTAADCIPFVTIAHTRNTSERFDRTSVRVTISGSTVTVTRATSGGSVALEAIVHVVEFDPTISTVKTGEVSGTGVDTFVTSLGLTSTAKSFLYFGYTQSNTTDGFDSNMVRGKITSTSRLDFIRGSTGGTMVIRWYVLECDNTEFDVTRGNFTMAATVTSTNSVAFTAVTLARSMVVCSYSTTETSDDPSDGSCMIDLVDTTHVRSRRATGGSTATATITVEFQVVQFESAQVNGVDRGDFVITGTSNTDTIGAVVLADTLVKSQDPFGSTSMASINGDDIGQRNARMDMSSTTVVRGRVVTNSTTTNYTWEVVEFVLGGATTETKTFTIDVVIQKPSLTKTFTIDTVIQKPSLTKTFTIDVIIQKPSLTKTFTIDTVIQKPSLTKTFTIDVVIQKELTKTFTIDVVLQKELTKTFTIDVVIIGGSTFTKTFTMDVVIQKPSLTKTFTIDVVIQKASLTKTFTMDVVIQKEVIKTFTIDVVIQKQSLTKTFTIDVVIQKASLTKTFTMDVVIQKELTKTFTIDVVIKALSLTKTFTMDVVISLTVPAIITKVYSLFMNKLTHVLHIGELTHTNFLNSKSHRVYLRE